MTPDQKSDELEQFEQQKKKQLELEKQQEQQLVPLLQQASQFSQVQLALPL